MQDTLDNKTKVMSNMGAVRDGSNIVAAMINAGILKPKGVEDVTTEINFLRNKFRDWHLEGLHEDDDITKRHAKMSSYDIYLENHNKEFKAKTSSDENKCTDRQGKAVWAIIYGNNGDIALESELPEGIDKYKLKEISFKDASEFLDKYSRK